MYVIRPADEELGSWLTRSDIVARHHKIYERPLPDWQLRREILPALEMAGLIIQEVDPGDRRRMLVYPADLKNI